MTRTAVEDLIEKLCNNHPNCNNHSNCYDRTYLMQVAPIVSLQLNQLNTRIPVGKLNGKGTGSINVDKTDARAAVLLVSNLQRVNQEVKQTDKAKYITENVFPPLKWEDIATAVSLSHRKIESLQLLQKRLLLYIDADEYNQPRRHTRTTTCTRSRIANASKPRCDRREKKDVCTLLASNDTSNDTSDEFYGKKGKHQRKFTAASTGASTVDPVRRESGFHPRKLPVSVEANSLLNPKLDVKKALRKSTHAINASTSIEKTTVTSRVDEFFEIALNTCQSDDTDDTAYLYHFAQLCDLIFQKIIHAFDDNITGSLAAQQERLAHLEDMQRKESAYVAATFCIVREMFNDYGIASNSYCATDNTSTGTYTDSDNNDHRTLFSFSKVIAASPSNVELDDLKQIHGHLKKLALRFESDILKFKKIEITIGSTNSIDELINVPIPPALADKSPTSNSIVNQSFLGEFPNKGKLSVSDKSRVDFFLLLASKRCDIDHCPLYIAEQCELLFQKTCTFCHDAKIQYEATDRRSNNHQMDLQQTDAVDLEAIYLVVVQSMTSEFDCSLSKFCDCLYGPLSVYFREVYQTIFKMADRVKRTEMKSDTIQSLKLSKRTCKKFPRTTSSSWLSTVINGELRHIRLAIDSFKIARQCNTIFQKAMTYYVENTTYSLAQQIKQCGSLQDIRRKESSYLRAIFLLFLEKEYYPIYREGGCSGLKYSLFDKVAIISFDSSFDDFKTIYKRMKLFSKLIHVDTTERTHKTRTVSCYKAQREAILPVVSRSGFLEGADFDASKSSNIEIVIDDQKHKRRSDRPIYGKDNKKMKFSPMRSLMKKSMPQNCQVDEVLPGALPKVTCTPTKEVSAFTAGTRTVARNGSTLVLESAALSVFKKYCLK